MSKDTHTQRKRGGGERERQKPDAGGKRQKKREGNKQREIHR